MQDAVIIGAGQAGPPLAARLAAAGQLVTLIEKRRLGGTCVNDGCIPTKTLVASARAAWVARSAAEWGVVVDGDVRIDMTRVKARKDAVVQSSLDGLDRWLGAMPGLTLRTGQARFVGRDAVEVDGERIAARRFFINTGARSIIPDVPGLREVALTHVEMMDIDVLPEHLVVIGSSFIALEFAQMYRRFGSRVTLIARGDRILSREDEDVAREIAKVLAGEGVDIRARTRLVRAERRGTGIRLHLERDGIPETLDASSVLVATGRVPNSDELGLERCGVSVDDHGYIVVDDRLQTSVAGIWALGDVNGRGAFTHTSYNDFEVVAANLLDNAERSIADRPFIAGLYVDPPLGRVGWSEREARASGRPILKGMRMMTRVGRARERGETAGFIKILVDAETQRIVGASILGIEADEAIHAIAATMSAQAPYSRLRDAVFAHPTVSELIPTVLGELQPLV